MQQIPVMPPPPRGPGLGPGARLAAGGIVLAGSGVGSVLAFYGVGYGLDALTDSGLVSCGDEVGCGIGIGFLMVLVAVAGCVVGFVVAVVWPFVLPGRWSTGRALGVTSLVTGALVLLVALVMVALVFWDAGSAPSS